MCERLAKTSTTRRRIPSAVVMLFSFLVFAVYISGYVGNFKDPDLVLDDADKLHKKHKILFPAIKFAQLENKPERRITSHYIDVAPWSGINNSWRPKKTLKRYDSSDRP